MSNRQRRAVTIDGIKYQNANFIANQKILPLRVVGNLCSDPRHCRVTERNEMMIRADTVHLLARYGVLFPRA